MFKLNSVTGTIHTNQNKVNQLFLNVKSLTGSNITVTVWTAIVFVVRSHTCSARAKTKV